MNLFQKLRSPFGNAAADLSAQTRARQHFVGTELRERREEFGLDLDSIGETLRIKPAYLAAIEQGRPQDLPGPAYALGFVRAYAHYLGLDSDQILENFKAESLDAQARPDLALPMPLGARSVPGGAILIIGLMLALCGYGTWYYLSTGERNRPERVAALPVEMQQALRGAPPVAVAPDPTGARFGSGILSGPDSGSAPPPPPPVPPPGIVASPAAASLPGSTNPPQPAAAGATPGAKPAGATAAPPPIPPPAATANPATQKQAAVAPPPTPAPDKTPAAATPAAVPAPDAAKAGAHVEIRALADCWIQVRASDDQSIVFSRVLKAGETYQVPRKGLFLRTGNAGALAIAVDGKPTPAIGGIGMLRRNVSLDPDPLVAGKAVHD